MCGVRLAMSPVSTGMRIARGLDEFVAGIVESVERVSTLLDEVEALIGRVGVTETHAEAVLAQVEVTASGADEVLSVVRQLVEADVAAVQGLSCLLDDLGTLLAGIRAMDRVLVDDATTVVRALPTVLDRLDNEVLPALTALEGLVPVVAQLGVRVENLNEVVADVGTLISGIPGTGRLLRRGERDARPAKSTAT